MNTPINHNQGLFSHPKLPQLETIGLKSSNPAVNTEKLPNDTYYSHSKEDISCFTYKNIAHSNSVKNIQQGHITNNTEKIFMNTIDSCAENGIFTLSGDSYRI